MEFEKIEPPSIGETSVAFYERYLNVPSKKYISLGSDRSSEEWFKFLDICGLSHISMSRLEVVDKEKFFLAKIKYGI